MPRLGHPRIEGRPAAPEATWPGAPGDALAPLGLSRGDLTRMDAALSGTIVLPGSPSYDTDRQGNPLYPASPRIIVKCATFKDVRLALGWAHEHGWPLTCRSGGHSTAGYSLNDGMILDVAGIDGIGIDTVAGTARIGAGAQFGAINSTLDLYGLHVPGG
ncbi:MAG: FAD-binding oxidoreductase, partial [Candidatus Limnocylindria bacterium]